MADATSSWVSLDDSLVDRRWDLNRN
jgi:hypothetical protein